MGGRLMGKRALIYGGGTGIGFAIAEAMAREGANLFLSGRRANILDEAAARLSKIGRASTASGDATRPEDVVRVTAAADTFLTGIDTLVVSAGAGGRTSIFDADPQEFQRIMDHTLRPAFLAVRYAAPQLLAAKTASVIIISSTYGLVGHAERVAYCGAKAGVIGMVKAMALDFATHGIRVNAICPGYVETPLAIEVAQAEKDPEAALAAKRLMHAIPRAGKLEEMGELAVYLASDLSAFMTGQAIAIDGGYSSR
ncbi:SDR family NAD(P)-dependent oxidoreductase [Taklimakanibacter lacteus]|uniref:SDR family NAD(P)-dependent oxidoreductase n=1 Tax=Taklimakanibacter lacteus TaxID=2268456 RepID=UPI0013C48C3B